MTTRKAKAILFHPAKMVNGIIRRRKRRNGKTITRLLEEAVVNQYGGSKERVAYFGK